MAGRRSGKHTHTIPAYKTAQMAGCRSGNTRIHTQSLPTRPHIWQVAGQGNTHTHNPCLQDRTDGRSPVRETHAYTQSLPTRPHRWQVVGQGTHAIQSLPTRPHRWQVAGQGNTCIHTIPAYKTAQMAGRRSGRHTHNPCRTDGRQLQLVRDCTELDIKYLGLSSYV